MPAPSPSRLTIALEFIVIAAAYLFFTDAIRVGIIPLDPPRMPVLDRTWVAFAALVVGIFYLLLARRDLSNYGLKAFRPRLKLIGLALLGVILPIVTSSLTDPIIEKWFGETDVSVLSGVVGDLPTLLFVLPFVWIFAAFGEEFFYRGFMMYSVAATLGGGRWAWAVALVAQAVLFAVGHSYQGVGGMIGVGLYGLIHGAIFLLAGRNLWAPALAHGCIDTLGLTLLYLGKL